MLALIAVTFPILLAVLGGFVSINPPLEKDRRKFWMGLFITLGVVGSAFSFVDRQTSDQDLRSTIKGLKD